MQGGYTEGSSAEEKVEDVMQKVTSACDAAMPRSGNGNPHKPVYWWSNRTAQLRAKCHKARRLSQRARGKPTFPELEEKFKLARSKLTKAIKHSKRQSWTELLGVDDEDPWERPYKVVMARLTTQSRQQPTCPEQLETIVSTLLPEQEPFSYQVKQDSEHIPPITREELLQENKIIGNSKAPGMDNISNVALKTAVNAIPETFLDMYNIFLAEGTFPERWKRQRLVLLPKFNKPPNEPSSYRPLCMLDSSG